MQAAMSQFNLSTQAYHHILKWARSIEDWAGCEEIHSERLGQSLQGTALSHMRGDGQFTFARIRLGYNNRMQTDVLLKRLQTFEFLRGLDHETLASLAQSAIWKVFPANAVVFWEGDTETNLYYLQYGSLKALKASPDGREQVLRFIGAGEIFNEVGVLAKRPNPATAMALEESGIWLIPRQALEEIVLAHPQTALQIIENMADKIIELVTLASDLSLKTVEARFAKFLLEQMEGDVIERRRWTNQTELASYLGTVPDVLSRVTRELTKAHLIEMDKQHIRILDRKGLEERARLQGKK